MQRNNPYADEKRVIDEPEKKLVSDLLKKIDQAFDTDQKDRFKMFEANRLLLRGVESDKAVKNNKRTNLHFSTVATVLPLIYAKNPDISVSPTEAVPPSRYAPVKQFAKTLETVLHRLFVTDTSLKRRAKDAVRATMTTSIGWVKLTYQRDLKEDPAIINRMNDIQDNLERLDALIKTIEDQNIVGEKEQEREELKQTMAGLEAKVEQVVSEGLVIDNVLSEDIVLLDDTVRSFDGYKQSDAIVQRLWYTEEKFKAIFGYLPPKATKYPKPKSDDSKAGGGDSNFYCAFEIWKKSENRIYTVCKGCEGYLRAPYSPKKLGKRWYGFFALGFNLVDGQFYPMSDIELLEKLCDEYNDTRDALKQHRDDCIPVRIARAGGTLTPEDIEKIQARKGREVVVISGAGGRPLSDDLFEFKNVPIEAAVYDTTPIRTDIELVSGAQDAMRSNVLKAKTATEADIMQQGLVSRTSERQDAIEDWISEMAIYAAEILLQELTEAQVKKIGGEAAQWPQLTRDQVFDQVRIEIRAGSTGKPNKVREQEQWGKVFPVIQDAMVKVAELRMQGQNDMADAIVELVRETVRRYDERIDLDKFIPPQGQDGEQNPGAELAMTTQKLTETTAALEQCQTELTEAQQELKSRREIETAKAVSEERKGLYDASAKVLAAQVGSGEKLTPEQVMQSIKDLSAQLQAAFAATNKQPAAAPVLN